MDNNIDVSIIIVNYKHVDLTVNAINSIREKSSGFTYEIIVVDNSESKEVIDELNTKLKNVLVIDSKSNLGFGRANNLGATYAKGKYLYFINSDTLLINNAIFELYDFMEKHNDVGICGSNLYTKDMKPNNSFSIKEKDLKQEKKYISFFTYFKKKFLNNNFHFNYTNNAIEIFGDVCGASLMIVKEDFNSLNGFDKDIFMYAEECMLCHRLRVELHKRIYNIPQSKIIHFEGGNFDVEFSESRFSNSINGNCIYYSKIFGINSEKKYIKLMIRNYKMRRMLSYFFKRNKIIEYKSCIAILKEKKDEIDRC